jgi:hypothetical protein
MEDLCRHVQADAGTDGSARARIMAISGTPVELEVDPARAGPLS